MTRIAVYQANTGIDPHRNAADLVDAARQAGEGGAQMLFTPEMSNLLDRDRKRAAEHITAQDSDIVLAAMRNTAREGSIWITLGSLAIRRDDGRWANRAFVIGPDGTIAAQYDKIHMFDVDLENGESWRESNAYVAGDRAAWCETPIGRLGLAICYDMRFPALFGALGDARCDAISVPAAFTVPTGRAHWRTLLRARAIEASAFVIAAAQAGTHEDGRETYGHSLVIDPWGDVLLDLDSDGPRIGFADIDPARIDHVRNQLPSLANRRKFDHPHGP